MYGALQGLNKAETAAKHGEEQVKIWRRSYDTPPPAVEVTDERFPGNDPKYAVSRYLAHMLYKMLVILFRSKIFSLSALFFLVVNICFTFSDGRQAVDPSGRMFEGHCCPGITILV